MLHVDASIARVREYAKAQKIAPSRLALLAGLSPNALRDFSDPNWSPRAETLKQLEDYVARAEARGEDPAHAADKPRKSA
jgi:hypothetical protein